MNSQEFKIHIFQMNEVKHERISFTSTYINTHIQVSEERAVLNYDISKEILILIHLSNSYHNILFNNNGKSSEQAELKRIINWFLQFA